MNWKGRKREFFSLNISVLGNDGGRKLKDHFNFRLFPVHYLELCFNLSCNQNNENMIFLFMAGDGISWGCRTKRSVWSSKTILRRAMRSLMILKCRVFCSKSFLSMCRVFFPLYLSSSHCVQINILDMTQ